jgi:hypothetical protein
MSDTENTNAHVLQDPEILRRENDELRARLKALEGDRVVHPEFPVGDLPLYRLNTTCFLDDDTLHPEGEELRYNGTPNFEMVPLNDAARARMQKFIDEQTDCARRRAESSGREFRGLITDNGTIIAQAMQDERQAERKGTFTPLIAMPVDKEDVPTMGNTETASQARRRGRPPKKHMVETVKAAPDRTGPPVPTAPSVILGRNYDRTATDTSL